MHGYNNPSITTPEAFIERTGAPDLDCWSRDIESLRQYIFQNSRNDGDKGKTWNEALYFAKKIAEIWKRDRKKIIKAREDEENSWIEK